MLANERLLSIEVLAAKKRIVKQLPVISATYSELVAMEKVGWFKPDLIDYSTYGYMLLVLDSSGCPALVNVGGPVKRDGSYVVLDDVRVPHLVLS